METLDKVGRDIQEVDGDEENLQALKALEFEPQHGSEEVTASPISASTDASRSTPAPQPPLTAPVAPLASPLKSNSDATREMQLTPLNEYPLHNLDLSVSDNPLSVGVTHPVKVYTSKKTSKKTTKGVRRKLFDSPEKENGSQSSSAAAPSLANKDDNTSSSSTLKPLPLDSIGDSLGDSEDKIHLSFSELDDSFVITSPEKRAEDYLTRPSSSVDSPEAKSFWQVTHKIFITEDDFSQGTKDDFMSQEQKRQVIHTYLPISKIKEEMAEDPDF
jgi:hypothetical protein